MTLLQAYQYLFATVKPSKYITIKPHPKATNKAYTHKLPRTCLRPLLWKIIEFKNIPEHDFYAQQMAQYGIVFNTETTWHKTKFHVIWYIDAHFCLK